MPPKRAGPIIPRSIQRDQRDLHAAHAAGATPQKYRGTYAQYIAHNNRRIKIQNADGTLTSAGDFYYDNILGIAKPTLYTYDQELIRDRFVMAYDGTEIKVRQWDRGAG